MDGTLTRIDRIGEKKTSVKGQEIDAWYSGKARAFAANLQGLMTPGGFPIWISDALPGSTYDITAAREQVLATIRPYLKDMPLLADSGYEGAGAGVHVPVKQPADGQELDVDTRTRNALLRSLRCLENAASRFLSNAGAPFSTSTSAPAESATSPKRCSLSPTSSTE
ncbi:transposase family protein [Nonomuraea sp. NPDC049784]|uniref:transposase family protein n=1 Tax=Nonomuraea sp. NPDC049784 TaxID=3154361 RepID=UPI0033C6AE37